MKRFRTCSIVLSLLVLFLSGGCQTPLPGEFVTLLRGPRLETALSVVPPEDAGATKSRYGGADDAISNWNLLVFENGLLKAKYYQDSGRDIMVDVTTDRPYNYYALANVGDLTDRFTEGVTTENDMAALRIQADVGNGLPMAWKSAPDTRFSRRQLSDGARLEVQMIRLTGRYDIVVNKSGLSAWTFTANRLSLRGVSDVTPFSARSRAGAASIQADEATAADLATLNSGGATHYYPLENCYGNLLPAGTSPWNKIPGNIAADAYPSYIEIGGRLRMTDGSALEQDVTYRFYLGENAMENFDVVRNVTHTVTLELSDEAIARAENHWKVETGPFVDTRSLAFTHEIITLAAGGTVEEPVIRMPSTLKYRIEMDANLVAAGVTVVGYRWGDPHDADRLTLQAPAGVSRITGSIRMKTLDGGRSAEALVVVGKQLESLRIGLWPNATEEHFHSDTTINLGSSRKDFRAHVYARYSDGSTADVTPGISFSYDADAFSCEHVPAAAPGSDELGKFVPKRRMGIYTLTASYTEDGVTCSAAARITLDPGKVMSMTVVPEDEQTLLTGGEELQYTVTVTYLGTDGSHAVNPEDVEWTFQKSDMLEYAGGGKVRSKYQRGRTYVRIRYTDRGETSVTLRYVTVTSVLRDLQVFPSTVYLPSCGTAEPAYRGQYNYARSNDKNFTLRAFYHDGTDEDITRLTDVEWTGNRPMAYWDGSCYHLANAVYFQDGTANIYRAVTAGDHASDNLIQVQMGPDESYAYRVYDMSSQMPAVILTASYTLGGVTKTASVTGTYINQAKPQTLTLTPNPHEVYAGGRQARFTAICVFDDGSVEDVTSRASWSADGLVTSQGGGVFKSGSQTGTTLVHASYTANGQTAEGNASLLVREPVITRVELQMNSPSGWVTGTQPVNLGSQQSWRILVYYDSGDTAYFTEGFSLSSSDPSVVSVQGLRTRADKEGSATVTALYRGVTSNGVTLTVNNHNYSYELEVKPASTILEWNGSRMFYAYLVCYDNGIVDNQTDVSSLAVWTVDAGLLGVASWDDTRQLLSASNTTDRDVSGYVSAFYDGMSDHATVTVRKRFLPSLSVDPVVLTWAYDASGSGSAQTFTITSNTDWTLSGGDSHWSVSHASGSGNATVTVYPMTRNDGSADIVSLLMVSASDVSTAYVTLTHEGHSTTPSVCYKVVTSVGSSTILTGASTTASAVLYASTNGGISYSTVLGVVPDGFTAVSGSACVSIAGSTIAGERAGTACIRGEFSGYDVSVYEDADLTVIDPAPDEEYLSAGPAFLSWDWNESGSRYGSDITVSSNVDWFVRSISAGFDYSTTATSVKVWPIARNNSMTEELTGSIVLGGPGVSDVRIDLSQGRRERSLSGIAFDQSSYDLVQLSGGSLSYSQSFSVTASYDDGSSEDVTAAVGYSDQGGLSIDASGGLLTATAPCVDRTVTASFGGKSATARYTALELECPESLGTGRLESQDDEGRNFVIDRIRVTLSKAFSVSTVERDVTDEVTCYTSSLIVSEGYVSGSGQQFHFTSAGSGTVTFTYTLNGKTVSSEVNLTCDSAGRVR